MHRQALQDAAVWKGEDKKTENDMLTIVADEAGKAADGFAVTEA